MPAAVASPTSRLRFRPSRRVLARLAVVAVLLLVTAGCRFVRRPDAEAETEGTRLDTTVVLSDAAAQDSIRAVVRAFHDALRVGDGSRVASLSVLGATVIDQEEGVEWRLGAGGGAHLPDALSEEVGGLGWSRVATDLVTWDHAALLVDRYRATVSGEDVPWTAVETFVFERTPEGWRIRHVHRSRGGAPEDAPGAFGPGGDARDGDEG